MATSKLPVDWVMVPEKLYGFRNQFPGVHLNLRLPQRAQREMERHEWPGDDIYVHKPVKMFLETLQTNSKVLMHFQGYGATDVGTALITVNSIYWTQDPYPRLDFKKSPEFLKINSCPNFWGAFILAITKADSSHDEFAREDSKGLLFYHCLEPMGLGKEKLIGWHYVNKDVGDNFVVQLGDGQTVAWAPDRNTAEVIAEFLNNLPNKIYPQEVRDSFIPHMPT